MGYNGRTMTETSFFDRVLTKLRAVPYPDLDVVARATGISLSNLRKIRYGEVRNPGVQTVQALHEYFEQVEANQHPAARPSGDGFSR